MTDPRPGSFAARLIETAQSLEELQTMLTASRDKLIRKRHKQGASLRQIASEARLSHTAVAKIVTRDVRSR